jgi:lysyl-tRNA synthetase class 2
MQESIQALHPDVVLNDLAACLAWLDARGLPAAWKDLDEAHLEMFESTVEHQLIQPTFIIDYPTRVSPLARKNDARPEVVERFEFFIGGYEVANAFSELNDPLDQAERFEAQMRAKAEGAEETMPYDADYIEALSYGMPPAAGQGIGIDRLAMILTDAPSIKDVILFPHMRPLDGDSK